MIKHEDIEQDEGKKRRQERGEKGWETRTNEEMDERRRRRIKEGREG